MKQIDSGIIINEAKPEDYLDIQKLWVEMHEFHAEKDIYYKLKEGATEIWNEWYLKTLNEKNKKIFIAVCDGKIAAAIKLVIVECPPVLCVEKYGKVEFISVSKHVRRRKLGQLLTEKSEEWFRIHNIRRIEANVASTNEVSCAFWNKMGFNIYQYSMFKEI